MRILHILRSEPDRMVRLFIEALSQEGQSVEAPLFDREVDYDQLLKEIFDSEKVICWW